MRNLLPHQPAIRGLEQSNDITLAYTTTGFGIESRSVISQGPADAGRDKAEGIDTLKCCVYVTCGPMPPAIAGGHWGPRPAAPSP